jgi:hypothetical protein
MARSAQITSATGHRPAGSVGSRTMLCRYLSVNYPAAPWIRYLLGAPSTTVLPLLDGCNSPCDGTA